MDVKLPTSFKNYNDYDITYNSNLLLISYILNYFTLKKLKKHDDPRIDFFLLKFDWAYLVDTLFPVYCTVCFKSLFSFFANFSVWEAPSFADSLVVWRGVILKLPIANRADPTFRET